MQMLVSGPDPQGHVVVVELDDGTSVRACEFPDGSADVDLTAQLCDLVLHGLRMTHMVESGQQGDPVDEVTAAQLVVDGTPPVFVYAHPGTRSAVKFDWAEASRHLSRAVADLLTSGVAADVAEGDPVPDDPAPLDGA